MITTQENTNWFEVSSEGDFIVIKTMHHDVWNKDYEIRKDLLLKTQITSIQIEDHKQLRLVSSGIKERVFESEIEENIADLETLLMAEITGSSSTSEEEPEEQES